MTQIQNKYTFWFFDNEQKKKQYHDCLKSLVSFNNCKQFWQIFQFMKKADQFPIGYDISLFCQGYKPLWQSEQFKNGGRMHIRSEKKKINQLFDNCVYSFVSPLNTFKTIWKGLRLKVRPDNQQIQLWISSQLKENKQMMIQLKAYLKDNILIYDQRSYNLNKF